MEFKKVGIIGCGLMGAGIAQTSAMAGFKTVVVETEKKALEKGFKNISQSLSKFAEKGFITEIIRDQALESLISSMDFSALAECDIVIEAIIENLTIKSEIYKELDKICNPETIFASNTSSISITQLMAATSLERQARFVGMHFFNPVPIMKLVEIVRTILTDSQVFERVDEFGKKLGKVTVKTSDRTGFIVNRLLVPYMLDAIRLLEEGGGSIVDIDNAMKLGCGYPMGPFTLIDFVGLDTTYYITQVMYEDFKEKRFSSPSLLTRMVAAGLFGRKSGKGFYDYTDPKNPRPITF